MPFATHSATGTVGVEECEIPAARVPNRRVARGPGALDRRGNRPRDVSAHRRNGLQPAGGVVVGDDHLEILARRGLLAQQVHAAPEVIEVVVMGDDDADDRVAARRAPVHPPFARGALRMCCVADHANPPWSRKNKLAPPASVKGTKEPPVEIAAVRQIFQERRERGQPRGRLSEPICPKVQLRYCLGNFRVLGLFTSGNPCWLTQGNVESGGPHEKESRGSHRELNACEAISRSPEAEDRTGSLDRSARGIRSCNGAPRNCPSSLARAGCWPPPRPPPAH